MESIVVVVKKRNGKDEVPRQNDARWIDPGFGERQMDASHQQRRLQSYGD
jgi:hypothetical protein